MNENRGGRARRLPHHFASLTAYNAAYPDAAFPAHPADRADLRRFDAAGQGIEDDLVERGVQMSIDFLPGGVPAPDGPDRVGNVVATVWGSGPVYVLAEDALLRAAWKTIGAQWPTTLSAVQSALNDVRRYGVPPTLL
ncbi:MAG: hypothetical protein AB7G47_10255 [Mycolicibacterium sp.]|uniref:hypothetical protein n=1 Tax=Mycolicibacterium sp. TaxID=2320850 RepID=UPI003D1312F8